MSNSWENILKSLTALAWLIMKIMSNDEVLLANVRIEEVSVPKKWCFQWFVYCTCMTVVFLFKLFMFHDCYKIFCIFNLHLFTINEFLKVVSPPSSLSFSNSSIILNVHSYHFEIFWAIVIPSEDTDLWQLPNVYPASDSTRDGIKS